MLSGFGFGLNFATIVYASLWIGLIFFAAPALNKVLGGARSTDPFLRNAGFVIVPVYAMANIFLFFPQYMLAIIAAWTVVLLRRQIWLAITIPLKRIGRMVRGIDISSFVKNVQARLSYYKK